MDKGQKKPKGVTKCKKFGVRLTVKYNNKRVYKSSATLKKQCARKEKAAKKNAVCRKLYPLYIISNMLRDDASFPV